MSRTLPETATLSPVLIIAFFTIVLATAARSAAEGAVGAAGCAAGAAAGAEGSAFGAGGWLGCEHAMASAMAHTTAGGEE